MLVFKQQGMSLTELLVVMAIIGMAVALVSPVTVSMMDKRKRNLEQQEVNSLIASLQRKAQWANQGFKLTLNKGSMRVLQGNKPYMSKSFEHLQFKQSKLAISSSGYLPTCSLELEQKQSLELKTDLCPRESN